MRHPMLESEARTVSARWTCSLCPNMSGLEDTQPAAAAALEAHYAEHHIQPSYTNQEEAA